MSKRFKGKAVPWWNNTCSEALKMQKAALESYKLSPSEDNRPSTVKPDNLVNLLLINKKPSHGGIFAVLSTIVSLLLSYESRLNHLKAGRLHMSIPTILLPPP